MSFTVPQRFPDFDNHERRQYENWSHVSRSSRSPSYTYKDKPFYGGVHPIRQKRWFTSKWFLGPIGVIILFYFLHQLAPGTQHEWEDELYRGRVALDWESRRERVNHAWGKDEYRPISGSGRNMIPEGILALFPLVLTDGRHGLGHY